MKFIHGPESIQGSDAWKIFRKHKIMASEAAIIMGSNPWKTPHKLWSQKVGNIPEDQSNERMEKGTRLEPIARQLLIERTGINFTPALILHQELDWMGASLDGISDCHTQICEIKCGSIKLYEQAQEDFIPPYYFDQMQHQLAVSGLSNNLYFVYYNGDAIMINVPRDNALIDKMLIAEELFHKQVINEEAPELTTQDYDLRVDLEWTTKSQMLKFCAEERTKWAAKEEECKKYLIDLAGHNNVKGNGVTLSKVISKGNIQYKDIPELSLVDLERYRAESRTSYRVTIS